MKLALLQLREQGGFLKTEDAGLLAAQSFVNIWRPLLGAEGLRMLPFQGTYMDQPDELMEILEQIVAALKR